MGTSFLAQSIRIFMGWLPINSSHTTHRVSGVFATRSGGSDVTFQSSMIPPGFGTVYPIGRRVVADNFSRGIVGSLFALDTVHSSVYVLLFTYSVRH